MVPVRHSLNLLLENLHSLPTDSAGQLVLETLYPEIIPNKTNKPQTKKIQKITHLVWIKLLKDF